MGSDAHLIVVGGPPGLAERAWARLDDLEGKWSRFLASSEVSELNRRAGDWVTLSGETLLLVERALDAWRLTVGRFDPTALGDLIRAGYDRSFEELGPAPAGGDSRLTAGAAGIEIQPSHSQVRLPAGTGFDPGGIGKGLAADLVVTELLEAGAAGACVNLGGDLWVAGAPPAVRPGPSPSSIPGRPSPWACSAWKRERWPPPRPSAGNGRPEARPATT